MVKFRFLFSVLATLLVPLAIKWSGAEFTSLNILLCIGNGFVQGLNYQQHETMILLSKIKEYGDKTKNRR